MSKSLIPIMFSEHRVLQFASNQLKQMIELSTANLPYEKVVLSTFLNLKEQQYENIQAIAGQLEHASFTDEFVITEQDQILYLIGRSERACLYAVYQFGEQKLGLNWIYPEEQATYISPSMTFQEEASKHFQPLMERRGFVFETIADIPFMQAMVDWLAKNKVNELFFTFTLWDNIGEQLRELILDRGFTVTLGGHSTKFFINRQMVSEVEQADHPYTAKKQLDYTDVSWQQPLIDQLIRYCKQVPNFTRLSLWPEDIKHQQQEGFLQLYITFTERLKASFEQADMDVEVEHIAYNAGLAWDMLEREGLKGSTSIETLFAYWGRDYRFAYIDAESESDQRGHQAMLDWVKEIHHNNRKLTMFEYYSDHFMLSPLFPMLPRRIVEDMAYYSSIGIDGITNLVVPTPSYAPELWQWNQSYNSYVFARALWKESLPEIEEKFYHSFDEEIREQVKRWFKALEQQVTALTAWNVPLFPARAVDPFKASSTKESERLRIIQQLDEICASAKAFIQSVHIDDHSKLLRCAQHYVQFAQATKEQWLDAANFIE